VTLRGTERRRLLPWLRRGGQLLVVALLVEYLVIPQFAGSTTSLHLLADVDGFWLPVAVVSELASLMAFALATRSVLRPAVRPSLWTVLRIDLSTIAISHSVPAGSASGTAAGIRLLSRAHVPIADATFAKFGQGVLAALILQALLWTAALMAVPRRIGSPVYLAAFGVGLGLMVLLVVSVVLLRRVRPAIGRLLDGLTRRIPRVPDDAGSRFVVRVGEEIDLVFAERHRLRGTAVWSLANWLLDSLALFAALLAYGHGGLGYDEVLLAFGIANTLNWVPITPGGLGLVEGALIPLIVGFGATHSVAILGVITWRLLSFWLPIPLGALAYASLWSSRRRPQPSTGGEG
jgi:uncharacterized protein (TIRG00374 family)